MTAETIQQLLAPVVMISACGLLCMAMYNRLGSIVSRLRQLHHERLEASGKIDQALGNQREHLDARLIGLEHQSHQMLARARLVRNALICLLSCVVCMLASSLTIGVGLLFPSVLNLAVALFVLGVGMMTVGMLIALNELRVCLHQVEAEHKGLEGLGSPSKGQTIHG